MTVVWRRLSLSEVDGSGELLRGNYRLAHMSQVLQRDLTGEDLLRTKGEIAVGYVRTDQQVDDCRTGKIASIPYRFLLYYPGSPLTSWKAFWNEAELRAFLAAWALELTGDLTPGGYFEVRQIGSEVDWLPVRRQED